jgi:hypothetical protein
MGVEINFIDGFVVFVVLKGNEKLLENCTKI